MMNKDGTIFSQKSNKFLNIYVTPLGYGQVFMNGKKHLIHVVLAKHFLGEKPPGFDVNHKDGNKLNNNIENLEYISHAENKAHGFRVIWNRPRGVVERKNSKFQVSMTFEMGEVCLGTYPNREMAEGVFYMAYEMVRGVAPWEA